MACSLFMPYLDCWPDTAEIENGKRKRTVLSLNEKLISCLKKQYKALKIYDYSFSYFVEDILLWVVENEDRFRKFVEDSYEDYPKSNVKPLEEVIRNVTSEEKV